MWNYFLFQRRPVLLDEQSTADGRLLLLDGGQPGARPNVQFVNRSTIRILVKRTFTLEINANLPI